MQVAEVGGEVDERARGCGVNDSAADVEARRKGSNGSRKEVVIAPSSVEWNTLRLTGWSPSTTVKYTSHGRTTPPAQRGHEGSQAGAKLVLVEFDAAADGGEASRAGTVSDAPRKRIRPLIESSTGRSSKPLIPMTAADTDQDGESRVNHESTPARRLTSSL